MDRQINSENKQPLINKRSRLRGLGIVAAGIGLGSVLAYLVSRAFGQRTKRPERHLPDKIVDDRGTGQETAAKILRKLRDRAFEASDEKLAVALGRPVEEVMDWGSGNELIDDDVVMKARSIAMNRGVRIE